jgi:hypothetical protein
MAQLQQVGEQQLHELSSAGQASWFDWDVLHVTQRPEPVGHV